MGNKSHKISNEGVFPEITGSASIAYNKQFWTFYKKKYDWRQKRK